MQATLKKSHKSWGGVVEFYSHDSSATSTEMNFSVFRPSCSRDRDLPILYWLSGLTCTEENFTTKSGYQQYAEHYGIIVVAPDTSPRGAGIQGEEDDWAFGTGAGFYVDATHPPWHRNYNMYTYVTEELPSIVESALPVRSEQRSIMGHSMGGHGALVAGLRRPDLYRSVSAFSPICAPSRCPWGEHAFSRYLGPDRDAWQQYDATELVTKAKKQLPLLVDQGLSDPFLQEQLRPDLLEQACAVASYPIDVRRREGYDHSYFYISTFIGEHFAFHATHLGQKL